MARVSIAGSFEPVEVDLWDHLFHTKQITKSVSNALDAIAPKIEAAEAEDDSEALVGLLGELFDVILAPADGKRTKPSALVVRKWESDELALDQLLSFAGELQTAQRPT